MKLSEARSWCRRAHGEQRYGPHPYSYHLDRAEEVAIRFGFGRSSIVRMGCQSHDVIEDTGETRESMLAAGFPLSVVDIASACTDEPGATRDEKKAKTLPKIRRNQRAVVVKLCDRIANVEFSVLTGNVTKFEMYKDEQLELSRQLRLRHESKLEPLWDHLERLFARGM